MRKLGLSAVNTEDASTPDVAILYASAHMSCKEPSKESIPKGTVFGSAARGDASGERRERRRPEVELGAQLQRLSCRLQVAA